MNSCAVDEEVERDDHSEDRLEADLADLAGDMEGITRRGDQTGDPGLDLAGDVGHRDPLAADDEDVAADELAERLRQRIRAGAGEQVGAPWRRGPARSAPTIATTTAAIA